VVVGIGTDEAVGNGGSRLAVDLKIQYPEGPDFVAEVE
jgi:hypothetical protein